MKERNINIDMVKVVAMYMIMCLHTTMYFTDSITGFIPYTISGVGMPLFFMVSGYLMWNRDTDYKYVVRKMGSILKFVAIICLPFWLVFGLSNGLNYFEVLFGSFVQKHCLAQFWYFLSIIIIYLTLPIIKMGRDRFKYFTIALIICFAVVSYFFHALNIIEGVERSIPQPFRLWNWFLFFSMGGGISLLKIKTSRHCLFAFSVISMVVFVLYAILLHKNLTGASAEYEFGNPILWLTSSLLFLSILSCEIRSSYIIKGLSALFLPSYVLHLLVISFVLHFTKLIDFAMFEPFVNCLCVMFITTIVCLAIMKIPFMNRIFKI